MIADTHALIWFLGGSRQLSAKSRRLFEDPDVELIVSAASAWEISVKVKLGKMPEAEQLERSLPEKLAHHDMTGLPISLVHAQAAGRLPMHHRDPFDRMLVAQSQVEKIPILSIDRLLDLYGVERIWWPRRGVRRPFNAP